MRPHPVHSKKVGRMINDKNSFEDLDADYMEVVEGIEGQRNTRKLADADFFNGTSVCVAPTPERICALTASFGSADFEDDLDDEGLD